MRDAPGAGAGRAGDQALLERIQRRLRAFTEVPAPPFEEGERSATVAAAWRSFGLDVAVDDLGDVVTELPGGEGPRVLLAAHLDTVFPAGTDVRVRELEGGRWAAPGIADDGSGLAVLTTLAEEVAAGRGGRRPRVTLAATVGEEGLGDLRGARRVVAEHAGRVDVFVAVDGGLGQVVSGAVGSRRLVARFSARGGHAWGDRGAPSAVHAMGDAIHALIRLDVPSEPRSSLNVGLASGGSSVNAIAEAASLTLDVRSLDPETLALLVGRVEQRLRSVGRRHRVEIEIEGVGDRPAGRTADERLVAAARAALGRAGIEARVAPSSTDANAAVAAGIPAIGFGVARGGDAHRLSEWIEPGSLLDGFRALEYLLEELARR
jgi:acetylornithine deacetylase/succinyl-diaminopimelate desuccinylase-like protein